MNIQQMYNTLHQLNELEKQYLIDHHIVRPTDDYSFYKVYTELPYIRQHNLAEIYWPQVEGNVSIAIPKYLSELPLLDEDILLFSGKNFQIVKQINFPSDLQRSNSFFDCMYLLEGAAELICCGEKFSLRSGDFFFLPPFVSYKLISAPDSIMIHLNIRRNFIVSQYARLFSGNPLIIKFFDTAVANRSEKDYLLLHTENQEELRSIGLQLLVEYLYEDTYKDDILLSYVALLFRKLMKYGATDIETTVSVGKNQIYYQQILDYLRQNYRSADLSSTADAIHFTKQYICKIIRTASGQSFSEVLTRIRIEKAMQFILETNVSMELISEFVGFSDSAHLSRAFKKVVGVSPSVYRRSKGKNSHE